MPRTIIPTPGTLVFAHTTGLLGRIIRFGERLRWNGHGAFYNHVAIVDRVEDGKVYVIQAEARGVTNDRTIEEVAPGGHFSYIYLPDHVDADALLAFAREEVGSRYGWLSILSTALDIITPLWFPALRRPYTWICSALVGESLRAGGWVYRWPDVYCVTPSALYLSLSGL